MIVSTLLFSLFASFALTASSYNILGIFPTEAKSHYNFIDPLMVRLAEKGHKITNYNPFPKERKVPNYVDVNIHGCFPLNHHYLVIETILNLCSSPFSSADLLTELVFNVEKFEKCAPLMQLLNSTEKYDLLVTESFATDFPQLFAQKFNIPFVAYVPNRLPSYLSGRVANPFNPSYMVDMLSHSGPKMNFFERVTNTLLYGYTSFVYGRYNLKRDEEMFERFLGKTGPSVHEVVKNTSVLFTNSHASLPAAVPMVPGVVQVGGIHIKPPSKLPKVCSVIFEIIQ
jgi:glucuronosyltransferase